MLTDGRNMNLCEPLCEEDDNDSSHTNSSSGTDKGK